MKFAIKQFYIPVYQKLRWTGIPDTPARTPISSTVQTAYLNNLHLPQTISVRLVYAVSDAVWHTVIIENVQMHNK